MNLKHCRNACSVLGLSHKELVRELIFREIRA